MAAGNSSDKALATIPGYLPCNTTHLGVNVSLILLIDLLVNDMIELNAPYLKADWCDTCVSESRQLVAAVTSC